VLGGGLGEGLLQGADEVGVGGFEGMLLSAGGSLVYSSACTIEEGRKWLGRAYLCSVIDLERRLARRVEVAVAAQCVVLAHNDLSTVRFQIATFIPYILHTASLLPGSFTVAYCCSLYFLNAGSSDCSKLASLPAKALISAESFNNSILEKSRSQSHTSYHVRELYTSAIVSIDWEGGSYQPLPAAPIR
jgi:hypothetical protein